MRTYLFIAVCEAILLVITLLLGCTTVLQVVVGHFTKSFSFEFYTRVFIFLLFSYF
jgi:hypothetical protein